MENRVRPRTPNELLVAEVWCELLGLESVQPTDDFFAVGGHSMAAVQVVYELSERTGVSLDLESFFDLATVEEIAAELDHRTAKATATESGNLREGEL